MTRRNIISGAVLIATLWTQTTTGQGDGYGIRATYTDRISNVYPAAHIVPDSILWIPQSDRVVVRLSVYRDVVAYKTDASIRVAEIVLVFDDADPIADYKYSTLWGLGSAHIQTVFQTVLQSVTTDGPFADSTIDLDLSVGIGPSATVAGSDLVFPVDLSAVHAVPVSVDYTVADGTAKSGSDFDAVSGTLTFAPGETSKSIAVPTTADADVASEKMSVVLSGLSGGAQPVGNYTGTELHISTATGTIEPVPPSR